MPAIVASVNGIPITRLMPHYCPVPAARVGGAKTALAERVAAFAADTLALPKIRRITWFEELTPDAAELALKATPDLVFATPEPMRGEFNEGQPDAIKLNRTLDGDDLVVTVGHELGHVQQFRERRIDHLTESEKEREADRVGAAVLNAWHARTGRESAPMSRGAPVLASRTPAGFESKAMRTYRDGDRWAAEIDLGYPRRRVCCGATESEARKHLERSLAQDPPVGVRR